MARASKPILPGATLGILGGVAALFVVLTGARAIANEVGPHAMHHRMQAFVAGAIDAAKPDAQQRATCLVICFAQREGEGVFV
jgi:hypothetical protein